MARIASGVSKPGKPVASKLPSASCWLLSHVVARSAAWRAAVSVKPEYRNALTAGTRSTAPAAIASFLSFGCTFLPPLTPVLEGRAAATAAWVEHRVLLHAVVRGRSSGFPRGDTVAGQRRNLTGLPRPRTSRR